MYTERGFLKHFGRRCLGRRGCLLIDRFYYLLITSFKRKVSYRWKSRAFYQAVALSFVRTDSLGSIGSMSYRLIVHKRSRDF